MSNTIKIIIADDQKLFVDSLRTVIELLSEEILILGTANNGFEVIELVEQKQPDIILLDVRMPEMDGVEVAKYLYENYPKIRIVMLTTFDDDDYVQEALKYNAVGYILKDIPLPELISILPVINEGTVMLSQKIASKILAKRNENTAIKKGQKNLGKQDSLFPEWYDDLTPRELDILKFVALGYDNNEIADELCIAEQTVKNHISIIYSKLGVHRRLQAMRLGHSLL